MKWVRIGAAPSINIFIRSPKVTKKSEVPVIFDIIDSYKSSSTQGFVKWDHHTQSVENLHFTGFKVIVFKYVICHND